MKKFYYEIKLRLKYLIDGIKTRKEVHLMDQIIYNDELYFVNNGTLYDGDGHRLWSVIKVGPFDENGRKESLHLQESQFRKARTWANFARGILHNYWFQMTYWHSINMRKVLEY